MDPSEQSRRLAASKRLNFPLLSDPNFEAIDAFGVRHPGASISGEDIARPATFILNREGQIIWRQLTDNWRVRLRPETVLGELKKIP